MVNLLFIFHIIISFAYCLFVYLVFRYNFSFYFCVVLHPIRYVMQSWVNIFVFVLRIWWYKICNGCLVLMYALRSVSFSFIANSFHFFPSNLVTAYYFTTLLLSSFFFMFAHNYFTSTVHLCLGSYLRTYCVLVLLYGVLYCISNCLIFLLCLQNSFLIVILLLIWVNSLISSDVGCHSDDHIPYFWNTY